MITTKEKVGRPLTDPRLDAEPLLLAVPQAAHLLGVGTTLAWEMVRAGRLPCVRLGRRVLVPRAAVERLARLAPGAHDAYYAQVTDSTGGART